MNGTMQLIIVGAIVAGAAAYLLWRMVGSWRRSSRGCGGSCGCASASPPKEQSHFVPIDQLSLRTSNKNQE
jgi:hypothetical protein